MKSTLKNLLAAFALATSLATTAHAQVYITTGNSIEEIDLSTGGVLASVNADNGYYASALTITNGVIYVSTEAPDQSQIVVASYNESLTELNSDVATFTPLLSGDGSIASVSTMSVTGTEIILNNSTYNNGELEKIDLSTTPATTTLGLVSIGDQNDNFDGIVAYNGLIYATRFQQGTIVVYNVADGSDAITPTAVALSQDPYQSGPILTYFPNGDTGGSLAISPDGKTLYTEDLESDTILTFNAATGALINGDFLPNTNGVSTPYWGNIYVDGNNLYVEQDYNGSLLDYDATTGQFLGVVTAPGTYGSSVAIDNSVYIGAPIIGGYGVGTPGEGGYGGTLGDAPSAPGSAPEPRSWALAGIVAFAFLGLYRSFRKTEATSGFLAA